MPARCLTRPRRSARTAVGTAVLAVLLTVGGLAVLVAPSDRAHAAGDTAESRRPPLSAAAQRGAALYRGDAPLSGTLNGHEHPLPTAATRCANCHDTQASAPRTAVRPREARAFDPAANSPSPVASADTANLGPPLDAASLTSLRARRGGPPSRFDASALCTLLRTGLDPAQILIPQSMPRYTPTDADCRDLWAYLYERD